MEQQEALHVRFRPKLFKEVLGNEGEVAAFRRAIEAKEQQTYLLIGPSGVGKTTLARIGAKKLGCTEFGLTEVNAAKYTGVDDMRAVEDMALYPPLGSPVRCIILDECHALSQNAWQSLLKITEEPPPHVFWFFCTTNPIKVPETIKTRSLVVTLKQVADAKLQELIEGVADKAKIKLLDGLAELIAYESNGSPRQALMHLQKVNGARSLEEAERNLQKTNQGDSDVMELCRFLCTGGRLHWAKGAAILERLQQKEEPPEGVRQVVISYTAKALRGAKDDERAKYLLHVMSNFDYRDVSSYPMLWLAVGRIVFN